MGMHNIDWPEHTVLYNPAHTTQEVPRVAPCTAIGGEEYGDVCSSECTYPHGLGIGITPPEAAYSHFTDLSVERLRQFQTGSFGAAECVANIKASDDMQDTDASSLTQLETYGSSTLAYRSRKSNNMTLHFCMPGSNAHTTATNPGTNGLLPISLRKNAIATGNDTALSRSAAISMRPIRSRPILCFDW